MAFRLAAGGAIVLIAIGMLIGLAASTVSLLTDAVGSTTRHTPPTRFASTPNHSIPELPKSLDLPARQSCAYPPEDLTQALPGSSRSGEKIVSYTIDIQLLHDGTTHIRETIVYDFGVSQDRHGILRKIPFREAVSFGPMRCYEVRNVQASSLFGTPIPNQVTRSGDHVIIRVGDPNQIVTGQRTYVIDYDLLFALTPRKDYDLLEWALGSEWEALLPRAVLVHLHTPVVGADIACDNQTLPVHQTTCDVRQLGARTFMFTMRSTAPRIFYASGLVVMAKLPKGSISVPAPRFEDTRHLQRYAVWISLGSILLMLLLPDLGGWPVGITLYGTILVFGRVGASWSTLIFMSLALIVGVTLRLLLAIGDQREQYPPNSSAETSLETTTDHFSGGPSTGGGGSW